MILESLRLIKKAIKILEFFRFRELFEANTVSLLGGSDIGEHDYI